MNAQKVADLWEANAEVWTLHSRAGYDVYRDALNTPAFLEILPSVEGLSGLDMGCGEGTNTRRLAALGARMTGIDIAPTFIRYASQTEEAQPLEITYMTGDAQELPFANESFDFITAFMSLMDMPQPRLTLNGAARVLRPGGFLQFSILHPCFVPPHRRVLRDADGTTIGLEVGRYFETGERMDRWTFSSAPPEERARVRPFETLYVHHTLSQWVDMLCSAGLVIEQFNEPRASEEAAVVFPTVEDTRTAPLFLHMRVRKPGIR